MSESVAANPSEVFQESKAQRRWRFRWVRRFLYSVAAMIVGVFVLRLVWGFLAQRELDNLIESYRAEGGPVTVDEFNAELDSVPEEENAAVLYQRAAESCIVESDSGEFLAFFVNEPGTIVEKPAVAQELLTANEPVIELVRKARGRPLIAWPYRLGDKGNQLEHPKFRNLTYVLWFSAACHLANGNHQEAVEIVTDLLHLFDAIQVNPKMISFIVTRFGIDLTSSFIEQFGAEIVVADGRIGFDIPPASGEQIRRLVDSLLNLEALGDRVERTFAGERAHELALFSEPGILKWLELEDEGVTSITPFKQVLNYLMEPILVQDLTRHTKYNTMLMRAGSAANWTEAKRAFPKSRKETTSFSRLAHPITENTKLRSTVQSNKRVAIIHFKAVAQARMAGIALAIKLYERDNGRYPTALRDLVPQYLPALPADPFNTDSRPFGYLPEEERPLLYSVGPDQIDDDSIESRDENGRLDPRNGDIPFYLKREKPLSTDEANCEQ